MSIQSRPGLRRLQTTKISYPQHTWTRRKSVQSLKSLLTRTILTLARNNLQSVRTQLAGLPNVSLQLLQPCQNFVQISFKGRTLYCKIWTSLLRATTAPSKAFSWCLINNYFITAERTFLSVSTHRLQNGSTAGDNSTTTCFAAKASFRQRLLTATSALTPRQLPANWQTYSQALYSDTTFTTRPGMDWSSMSFDCILLVRLSIIPRYLDAFTTRGCTALALAYLYNVLTLVSKSAFLLLFFSLTTMMLLRSTMNSCKRALAAFRPPENTSLVWDSANPISSRTFLATLHTDTLDVV